MSRRNILLIAVLSIFAVKPLFRPYYFSSHDGFYHIARLAEIDRSILDGRYYARWLPDFFDGRGAPILNFYPPLSYYLAEIFRLGGFAYSDSIKLVYIFSFLFSGIAMYAFTKEVLGENSAIVAAIAYVYAPYRFVDVYVRGAYSEAVLFPFVPAVFYFFFKLISAERMRYLTYSVFFLSGLILTHATALVFIPLLLVFLLIAARRERLTRGIKGVSIAFLISLGLSAFYWLPAITESKFIEIGNILLSGYREHFVNYRQLVIPSWGYGLSKGPESEMSFQVGPIHILGLLISPAIYLRSALKDKRSSVLYFSAATLIAIFFMLEASAPLWRTIPFLKFISFPWRFLVITTFATSFILGALATLDRRFMIFIPLVIMAPLNYAAVSEYIDIPDEALSPQRIAEYGIAGSATGEYLPKGATKDRIPNAQIEIIRGAAQILFLHQKTGSVELEIDAKEYSEIRFAIFYFPGWNAYLDEKRIEVEYDENKLILVKIPQGTHRLALRFEDTPMRKMAKYISLLSIVSLLLYSYSNEIQEHVRRVQ